MNLFSAKGFEGTTTREIAKAAGVSEAIIFRHFATKEDLYAAIIDFIIQGHSESFYTELNQAIESRNDTAVFETLAFCILETHRKGTGIPSAAALQWPRRAQAVTTLYGNPGPTHLQAAQRVPFAARQRRGLSQRELDGFGSSLLRDGQSSFADSEDLRRSLFAQEQSGKWPENLLECFFTVFRCHRPEGKGNDFFYGLRVILMERVWWKSLRLHQIIIVALLPTIFLGDVRNPKSRL